MSKTKKQKRRLDKKSGTGISIAKTVIDLPGGRRAIIIREADPDGRIVAHPRTVSTMDRMLKAGTITPAMFNAGRDFHSCFTTAALNSMPMSSMERTSGHGRAGNENFTVAQIDALKKINSTLNCLGGPNSLSGSCVWHVVGCETSIREWARRQRWNGSTVHHSTAQGVLIAALETLAAHYGYVGMEKKLRL